MRLTQILNRQHIGFMFKKHWLVQGKPVPINTKVEEYLKSKGIPVEDALEFVKEKPEPRERIEIVGPHESSILLDKDHPYYKEKPCYTLKHTNVLLEGISQAQVLTKTIIAEDKLPQKIEEMAAIPAPKAIHENVKKAILSANVFDCEQKKLPKIKDPERPAYNFPRILGISDKRRNEIITNKLLHLIERSSDIEATQSKYIVNDVECQSVFNKDDELIQFQEVSNILVTSNNPVQHELNEKDISFIEIPDLYPVKHTITLPKEHFYGSSKYPIHPTITMRHPHTTWLHYNSTEVNNVYETPVTPTQILGRSLTHAFAVATAYAKQLHGENVKDLPEPVYINCIQTDGQKYHFGILQLNTLNVDGTEGTKNVWYCKNDMELYGSSKYLSALPVLENYNPKVYEYINAFYNC
ncbi:39S ribosomal protein L37, mitochondrial [Hyposmocoma kahamanoa]|uniref:39S ribosomal protein L37, mitochondrial n=1 Tax=Hyposmocoma kahamanoa TaxID=1477025 RepID=UPI000E6DA4DA|nr:39S ribosomal protein L37, mitochondrial [Hyposmocoma kahamanoa]